MAEHSINNTANHSSLIILNQSMNAHPQYSNKPETSQILSKNGGNLNQSGSRFQKRLQNNFMDNSAAEVGGGGNQGF